MERDVSQATAEVTDKRIVTKLPDIALKELLIAFKEAMERSEIFAHHHVQREPLSVRERMTQVLVVLEGERFTEFSQLFDLSEGRTGVTVTFLAILELMKETLIDVVQSDPYGPIHVRVARATGKQAVDSEAPQSEFA